MVLLQPLIGLQNHLHSISTHSLRTELLKLPARCRLGPCFQVRIKYLQAMRNSDPRVTSVFVHGLNSDFHSIFTL